MANVEGDCELDHIDGNRLNNAIANLREASSGQNKRNAKRRNDNTSGYKGVWLHAPGQWRACIKLNGKNTHVGLFSTPEAAFQARRVALVRVHGKFARAA